MKELVLKCDKLTKKFGSKTILKNISFELYSGDILAFIGPNGSGKTTTIKLILGLQNITSGNATINGFDVEKDFINAIKRVGTIVENPDFYMNMTGRENLEIIKSYYDDIPKSRVDEVAKITGLSMRIDDKVSKYSLGMRQRLGIAQALINNPKLLILDEPTNGLDPEGIKELRDLLKELAEKQNIAIFISSHNLSELESFCNKVCIIKNGVIIETNDVKKLKKNEEDNKLTYIIEVSKLTGIKKHLGKLAYELDEENNKIMIKIARDKVPDLIQKLVDNKFKIYSCYEKEISLEEAFLKKTGGNIIV